MSNPPKPIPHDVQKLLDESQALISTIEAKQKPKSPQRPLGQATAQVLQNPAPLPEMPQETSERTSAMDFLMRSRGYLLGEDVRLRTQKLDDKSQQVVSQSLNAFFMGQVPDMNATAYKTDAKQHSQQVLLTAGPAQAQRMQHKGIKTSYRTLDKSILVFKHFVQEPVPVGASIFTHALRGFTAAFFLLQDLCEALRTDAKTQSEAAELVLGCLRAALSDEKAGEMLLVGELARLRGELRDTNMLLERNAFEAKNLLLQLERRRAAEVQALTRAVAQEHSRREEEGAALLQKAEESANQVQTLRALVDAIRADQSVQEIARLKSRLAEAAQAEERQKNQIAQLQQQLAAAQKAFSDFKIEASAAQEQIETLRFELRRADQQREICKSCGQKVHTQSKQIADDIQARLARNQEIIERQQTIQDQIQRGKEHQQLIEMVKKVVEADEGDAVVFKMDMAQLAQEVVLIEHKLRDYPTVEQLQTTIAAQKTEIERLKAVEVEFFELKAAHKKMVERSNAHIGANENDAGAATSGPANTAFNQRIAENQITLLRVQPLYFLIPKQFDVKLLENGADGVHPLAVTSSYVQCIIYKFVSHLVGASLSSGARLTDFLGLRISPPKANSPQQLDEPVQALFTGFMYQQYSLSQSPSKQQDAELAINKVAYVLSKCAGGVSAADLDDRSGFIQLGSALFNQPLTADELQFLLFVYALACGGVNKADSLLRKQMYRLRLSDTAPERFLTVRRACIITQVVLSKTTQKDFIARVLESGRRAGAVRDLPADGSGATNMDVCDADLEISRDLLPKGAEIDIAQQSPKDRPALIRATHFAVEMLRAYRSEQLIRIEALRVMYAADLLESGERFLTDSTRYRIVRQVIQSINPLAPAAMVDSAYLDTIWRSPNALWAVLIDACRVRGIFSAALRLPPLDCVMQLCGGYGNQHAKYDYERLFKRLVCFTADFRALAAQLLAMDEYELKSLGIQLQTIMQTDLGSNNILMVVAVIKSVLLQIIDQICAFAAANAADPSQIDASDLAYNPKINKQNRLPAELYLDVIQGLLDTATAILGWAERDKSGIKQAKKADPKLLKK